MAEKQKVKLRPRVMVTGSNPLAPGALGSVPDRVWFSQGLTINLGNYESARIDAGMATDRGADETLEAAVNRCRLLVSRVIEAEKKRGLKD